MCIYTYVYIYIYIYIYICVCVYIYIYIYIHTYDFCSLFQKRNFMPSVACFRRGNSCLLQGRTTQAEAAFKGFLKRGEGTAD